MHAMYAALRVRHCLPTVVRRLRPSVRHCMQAARCCKGQAARAREHARATWIVKSITMLLNTTLQDDVADEGGANACAVPLIEWPCAGALTGTVAC